MKVDVYEKFQENGFFLSVNSYKSTLPDTREIKSTWWDTPPYQSAFDMIHWADVDQELEKILRWADDLKMIPADSAADFCWNNPMFAPLDSMSLYGMIREYKPQQIIEVGSGYSTEVALLASKHTKTDIHCIEPYPSERLLGRTKEVRLTKERLQDVSLDIFMDLKQNDILFIDSSHSAKIGSDVHYLIFEILPRLAKGVIVHVHDMFLPYEYPRKWLAERGVIWNEQYLLLAYLMQNSDVEILMPVFSVSVQKESMLRERLKDFAIWNVTRNLGGAKGASLWFRKTK